MASAALEKIAETEQNNYFLRQIRKEETKLYFSRANQAMRDKELHISQPTPLAISGECIFRTKRQKKGKGTTDR